MVLRFTVGRLWDFVVRAARLSNRHRPAPDSSAFLARAFRRRPHLRVVRPRKLLRESRLDRPAAWPPVARSVHAPGARGVVGPERPGDRKHTDHDHVPTASPPTGREPPPRNANRGSAVAG